MLIHLSGEFGNNLFKYFGGWGIAMLAEREFNFKTRIVLKEQVSRRGGVVGKARKTSKELKRCFSNTSPDWLFKDMDFGLGNELIDKRYFKELNQFDLSNKEQSIDDLRGVLKDIADDLNSNPDLVEQYKTPDGNINDPRKPPKLMVKINSLHVFSIVNEFYDELLETFVFDEAECCGKTLEYPPLEDESVLHYRNFATEMKEFRRESLGFVELSGDQMVHTVLGSLQPGDKLAVAGRNLEKDSQTNTTLAYDMVEALKARGFDFRFSPGTEGVEDFCFLKKARKELVGTAKSTFLMLAGFLGGPTMKVARFYQFVTDRVVEERKDMWMYNVFQRTVGDNWTNPELMKRIVFEQYFDSNRNNETDNNTANGTNNRTLYSSTPKPLLRRRRRKRRQLRRRTSNIKYRGTSNTTTLHAHVGKNWTNPE